MSVELPTLNKYNTIQYNTINTTWENLQIEKHKSVRWAETNAFLICAFRSADFLRWCLFPKRNLTHNLFFLFPIVFGINLIHFFDFSTRKKNGAAGNSIVCFAASIPCRSRHLTVRRMRTVSKSAKFLATESVNSAPFKRGETEVQIFWQGKAQYSSPILRCTFLARKEQNSSPILARQWWRHFRLSLSLCIIGSAEALPILCVRYFWWERERERERDTERERERERERDTERERDRRKWCHHCRPKIGDEFTLSLAKNSHNPLAMGLHFPLPKNSHFSFLPSHFPSLSSHRGHHGGAMSSHFPLPKIFFALRLCSPLFQMARAARRVIENPRQLIKSCPVLFCSSHRKTESN